MPEESNNIKLWLGQKLLYVGDQEPHVAIPDLVVWELQIDFVIGPSRPIPPDIQVRCLEPCLLVLDNEGGEDPEDAGEADPHAAQVAFAAAGVRKGVLLTDVIGTQEHGKDTRDGSSILDAGTAGIGARCHVLQVDEALYSFRSSNFS